MTTVCLYADWKNLVPPVDVVCLCWGVQCRGGRSICAEQAPSKNTTQLLHLVVVLEELRSLQHQHLALDGYETPLCRGTSKAQVNSAPHCGTPAPRTMPAGSPAALLQTALERCLPPPMPYRSTKQLFRTELDGSRAPWRR